MTNKKRMLQLGMLAALLIAVLAAGIGYFARSSRPRTDEPDESAPAADLAGAVDPTGAADPAGAANPTVAVNPTSQRYQFRLVNQWEEEFWGNGRAYYEFYPYEGELLHMGDGEDVWLELSGLTNSEKALQYDLEEIGFSAPEDQLLSGLYLDESGVLWSLIKNRAGEYSVGKVGPDQDPADRRILKHYPLQYGPQQFAVWENAAVLLGDRRMAIYDLESGEPTLVEDVASFCLDGRGGLYYYLYGDRLLMKYSLRSRSILWEKNTRTENDLLIHQLFFHPELGLFSIARYTGKVDCRDPESGAVLYTLFSVAEDTELDYSEDRFYNAAFAVDSGYCVWLSLVETDFDTVPFTHTRYTWGFQPFQPQVDPAQAVTLTITAPYPVDAVVSSVRMYQRKHPEVEVIWDTQYISREEFWAHSAHYAEQLALRLMTGDVGDILMLHGSGLDVDAILKTDVMFDLSARLDACPFREDLEDCVIEALRGEDGAVRGLPVAIRPQYLIYNETLAGELGLTWDPEELTWSQLLELAEEWQAQGKDLSLFGSYTDDMAESMLYGMLLANLDTLSGNGSGADMSQPWLKEMLEQLDRLKDSTQLSQYLSGFWWSSGSFEKTLFLQTTGADYGNLIGWLRMAEEANGVTLRLVPTPKGEVTETRQSYAFCWGIPSVSGQKDAAWDLLEFLISQDGLVRDTYFTETCLLNRAADRERFEEDIKMEALYVDGVMQIQNEERHYAQFRAVLDHPTSRLSEPLRWYNAIYVPISRYLEGTASLDEALAQAQENWGRVLAE